MQYNFLKDKISKGLPATRKSWGDCKIVRAAVEGDYDFINYPPTGLFVTDCPKRECDCKIAIYNPSKEDLAADDWVISIAAIKEQQPV